MIANQPKELSLERWKGKKKGKVPKITEDVANKGNSLSLYSSPRHILF